MTDSSGEEIFIAEKIAILAGKVARVLTSPILFSSCTVKYSLLIYSVYIIIVYHLFYLQIYLLFCVKLFIHVVWL